METCTGRFDADATGGWGVNRLVPLRSVGTPVIVEFGGTTTLRYTSINADFDYLQFVPAEAPLIVGQPLDTVATYGDTVFLGRGH